MGEKISLYSRPSMQTAFEEARMDVSEGKIQKQIDLSKKVYQIASEVESLKLNQFNLPPSETVEQCAQLSKRISSFSSINGLTSSTKRTVEAVKHQLAHMEFALDFPIVEDVDSESALPNFAIRLLDTADKIRKAPLKSLVNVLQSELDPVQLKEVQMLLPKGEADPETVAQAVETYLDSLQNQAQMAEMLHRSGQSEFAQSILDSMQKRMGD